MLNNFYKIDIKSKLKEPKIVKSKYLIFLIDKLLNNLKTAKYKALFYYQHSTRMREKNPPGPTHCFRSPSPIRCSFSHRVTVARVV